ncbi:hypothetical protein G7Y89_g10201 [Cudoniella acicularis]|uniref:Uncharacterized protein n=1 Tax=Cudoniella acicularis TaxID=354080 RepID=A0A8H4RGY1_9HELO|nr:hypothetical protein G7Y89_g10201 [Cudoniella acicularis]
MKAENPALHNYLPTSYRNGVYREDLEQGNGGPANGGPSSSSTRPRESQYPDEDLPPYEETLLIPKTPLSSQTTKPQLEPEAQTRRFWYQPPPALPFSNNQSSSADVLTCFPDYSTDANTLQQMIYEQASYPPTYYLELKGTHTETTYQSHRRGSRSGVSFNIGTQRNAGFSYGSGHRNRRSSISSRSSDGRTVNTVVDFFIRINITHLLTRGPDIPGQLELILDNVKGYRGGIYQRKTPTIGNFEAENQHEELKAWCDTYVADPSLLKSFRLERNIINHDTRKLEHLLRSLVKATGYRGNVSVEFPVTHRSVTVYSPGMINRCRMTTWIRWVFYLTFLWIFSWPFLFLSTAKYQVVKVVFPYANISPEDEEAGYQRRPTVMSETAWFYLWEKALRRGVLEKVECYQVDMGDEYRLATEEQAARTMNIRMDNPIGVYGVGAQFTGQPQRDGWGFDI